MNSLINMRILEENINEIEVPKSNPIDKEVSINNLSQNADDGTPNTKIDIKNQVIIDPTHSYNIDDFEKLEDKINNNYMDISDSITESFYEVNRELMLANTMLESISIAVLRHQREILTECAIDSPRYSDDINTLIESSGQNIFNVIIEAIKSFIEKVRKFLKDIGVNISLSFVNYEKWSTAKSEELKKKASECGSQVDVEVYKWDKTKLFEGINFKQIQGISEQYVKTTTDKDTMSEIESDIASKYSDSSELRNDVYCHALAIAVGGNPNSDKFTNKDMAKSAFSALIKFNKKTKYMDLERTDKYLKALKNIKNDSNSCIASMRNTFVNPDFERLLKDTEKEARSREDKADSKKYKYYRLRFEVLSAIQNACDDIYRMKITLMKEYARELYNSLKVLDEYNNKSTNESIDISASTEIKGYTLHE